MWYDGRDADGCFVASSYFTSPPIVRRVMPAEIDVLNACDGRRTLAGIALVCGTSVDDVTRRIERWETEAPGAIVWAATDEERARAERHARLARRLLAIARAADEAGEDAADHHRTDALPADVRFDTVETTVSHAFRIPHRALAGRSYGSALCDRLLANGALVSGPRVLEIGGGTGLVAARVLDRLRERAPDVYARVRYTILDLSPALQQAQRDACRDHAGHMAFLSGHALETELADASVDLLICNEMIADLPVTLVERASIETSTTPGATLVRRYGLDLTGAPARFTVNSGAIGLVERVGRWLAPGGLAAITEYGALDQFPAVVDFAGHKEFSIHFGHLRQVADALGLEASTPSLGDYLGFDGTLAVLGRDATRLLVQHLWPALGEDAKPLLVYEEREVLRMAGTRATRLGNLRYVPLRSPEALLNPFSFHALVLGQGAR